LNGQMRNHNVPGLSIPATRGRRAPWEIEFLFRTEGVHGIDFGGAHRWDVARNDGSGGQSKSHRRIRQRVDGPDAEQQRRLRGFNCCLTVPLSLALGNSNLRLRTVRKRTIVPTHSRADWACPRILDREWPGLEAQPLSPAPAMPINRHCPKISVWARHT